MKDQISYSICCRLAGWLLLLLFIWQQLKTDSWSHLHVYHRRQPPLPPRFWRWLYLFPHLQPIYLSTYLSEHQDALSFTALAIKVWGLLQVWRPGEVRRGRWQRLSTFLWHLQDTPHTSTLTTQHIFKTKHIYSSAPNTFWLQEFHQHLLWTRYLEYLISCKCIIHVNITLLWSNKTCGGGRSPGQWLGNTQTQFPWTQPRSLPHFLWPQRYLPLGLSSKYFFWIYCLIYCLIYQF